MDYVIASTGTGGTIGGIARRLKELKPTIVVVGVDPVGSILAQPESMNVPGPELGWQMEGIGYDFIPRTFDRSVVDSWMKGPDKDSFIMARRLMREEGFMCGGTSGTAMWAAIKYIKDNKIGKDKTVVVVLPDNIRNYMTKHLNNDWMYERGYMTETECAELALPRYVDNLDWGQQLKVSDLAKHEAVFVQNTISCQEVIELSRKHGFDQFPVKNEAGKTVGVLTMVNLMVRLGKS